MKFLLTLFLFGSPLWVFSQKGNSKNLSISGYLESYYSYDFNQPDENKRPDFLYNFARHNEFSFNLALLKVTYEEGNIRSSFALMTGNYAQYNLQNEPTWAQFVNEASVGVRIHNKLWLDVGIMPSHIGFESWYGMDCWHLSRSLMAENSPYFLTGARLSYEFNPKLDLVLWATNGWQNVQRQDRSRGIGLGIGINHRPVEGLVVNYSNYVGNEGLDPIPAWRFFNNFYLQYEKADWGLTLGTDYGIQEVTFIGVKEWYGLTASIKKTFWEKLVIAGRAEYYSDPSAIILNESMKISGLSANLDFPVRDKALIRLEARQFISPKADFSLPGARFSKGNTAITASFAVRF
ncbi:outer membrane beta-barrel protein [Cecembia rubra]|uniref:Putative OmpL-like beta-barrel porin-2 n=1 Tax=Cecembia rubra TaxID=1485585 RepID=A0A2P8E9X7_9BACT|nr:outer membrane beta-barrel protein [Cecembia rubra]PSL06237.1 putative OmpL-like beta-barrel porin-2 [Cecembia rubra]